MSKLTTLAAALLACSLVSAPTLAADTDAENKPYITVNGYTIPQYAVDAFIAERVANGVQDTPALRAEVREEMLRRALIASEAKKDGLDKRTDVKRLTDIASELILVRTYVGDYLKKHPVSDAEVKKVYDDFIKRLGKSEYKARHILVADEATAKDIIARLGKGEKFEDLAKQSLDPGSKESGGELGWNPPSVYVQPFADALKSLKKGEYTKTPVHTQFGYHVIQQEDVRPLSRKPPTLEELKPQLTQTVLQQKLEAMIDALKKNAKIQ